MTVSRMTISATILALALTCQPLLAVETAPVTLPAATTAVAEDALLAQIPAVFATAAEQYRGMLANVTDTKKIPRTVKDGKVVLVDPTDWTSGFFGGAMWYLYDYTGDGAWKKAAADYTKRLESIRHYTGNHDVGFMLYCSYGNGQRVAANADYRAVLLDGAKALTTRFDPKVGVIKSWDGLHNRNGSFKYPVIIDNMMNLELLMYAARESGDAKFRDIAIAHADKTLANHFRADHSSYHVVAYDPATGAVVKKQTHQGYADESLWARGQAWGLYGFTMMARETGKPEYLAQAEAIANLIIHHPALPADKIPYWDFMAPGIPNAPRDASAAAVMASGLLELSLLTPPERGQAYRELARQQLTSLASPDYLAKPGENGNFILKHSVGHLPAKSEIDVPLNYADYYFLEALLRYRAIYAGETLAKTAPAPSTVARFVPERKDDFAWENDLVAFRAYGPALRSAPEDSGVDCWLKSVPFPIIDRWYGGNTKGISYHVERGEGYDPYHVGSTRGCGGTALWQDGQMVTSDTFTSWKVEKSTPSESVFTLSYHYDSANVDEQKRITIRLGEPVYESVSRFTKDGKPLVGQPIAIGITTHNGKATTSADPKAGWIACWEIIDWRGIGTGVIIDPARLKSVENIAPTKPDMGHILAITTTDANGETSHRAGFGWVGRHVIHNEAEWKALLGVMAAKR